jgi:hypothetical protein
MAVLAEFPYVYFTVDALEYQTTGTGSLSRVRADGSEPATVLAGGLTYPYDVVVDADYLYWVEGAADAATGRVMKLKK